MELRPQDWPRRRLRERGPGYLGTAELLAVVLTGMSASAALDLSYALLARFGSLAQLAQASLAELCQVPGLGQARASQILAALELSRRLSTDGQPEIPLISCPHDAARVLQEYADRANHQGQEELYAILLNAKHRVLGVQMVYRGSLNSTPFRPADLLREAVRQGAAAIVAGHNHPSGEPDPSREDIDLTRELQRASDLLGITTLDHVILGCQGQFYSLKEHGHL